MAGKPDSERPGAAAATHSRVRTLIVDDSESVRIGLSRLLEAQPHCELVGAVSDPASAIERTRATQPHVVLQDFSMPGVDALDLIRSLCACRPAPAVLVLSAFADAQAARRATEAGAIGWVLKDVEPAELFAALLGAAGFSAPSRAPAREEPAPGAVAPPVAGASHPEPVPESVASLDARTVWALLRALAGDPAGLTVESVATRAVLPVAVAARYLTRMTARHPALVVPVAGSPGRDAFLLTNAGQLELQRLERRNPAQAPLPAPQLLG